MGWSDVGDTWDSAMDWMFNDDDVEPAAANELERASGVGYTPSESSYDPGIFDTVAKVGGFIWDWAGTPQGLGVIGGVAKGMLDYQSQKNAPIAGKYAADAYAARVAAHNKGITDLATQFKEKAAANG